MRPCLGPRRSPQEPKRIGGMKELRKSEGNPSEFGENGKEAYGGVEDPKMKLMEKH